jgi:hypothetical protein
MVGVAGEYSNARQVEEWIAQYVELKITRLRAGNDVVREQLRRSYQQIALSEEVLKSPVPETWQSEAPEQE